jgi:hypothetical protein
LIAYNLIRREMACAAFEAKCEPSELSFVRSRHLIQHEMMWAARTPAFAKLPAVLRRLRAHLKLLINVNGPIANAIGPSSPVLLVIPSAS